MLLAVLAALQLAAPPVRILFIGNSLTYANELPAMVCALARAGGRQAACEAVAKPDYSLEDHWNDPDARRTIARGWDFVVLQQGPSAMPESRRSLIEYVKRFDGEIRKAGARTAVYMVWPARTRSGDFEGVRRSYSAAARAVDAVLLPAGDAWRAAWAIDGKLSLYAQDGFHPSPMGSYLASLVIYRQLFGAAPPAMPVPGGAIGAAEVLRRAAEDAVTRKDR